MHELHLSIVSNCSVSYNAYSIGNKRNYPAEGADLSRTALIYRPSLDMQITPL